MKIRYLLPFLAVLFFSCTLKEEPDPNGTDLEKIKTNASREDIMSLVTGTESGMRYTLATYFYDAGIVGREFYWMIIPEPRYSYDLLGGAYLDNNAFYTTGAWNSAYRVVNNANILMEATKNTTALNAEEKEGVYGFAKTMQAYQLLLALNLQYTNGIRTDVSNPDKLGPFLGYSESLTVIAALLDAAHTHLNNAGIKFMFRLSSGFKDFATPAAFKKLNRSLAARVAVYREDFPSAKNLLLNESFMDLTVNAGDPDKKFYLGAYHVFSNNSGDLKNILYNPDLLPVMAHPLYRKEIELGDDRESKIFLKGGDSIRRFGLASIDYVVTYTVSATDSFPVIRNEELILLFAESCIRTGDYTTAVQFAINIVRAGHNLPDYSGGMTEPELINELLNQRRYSLYCEGHRWVDMRRYGRLSQLPVDRPGDQVWEKFPRPLSELSQ